jgi:hypothetical protein
MEHPKEQKATQAVMWGFMLNFAKQKLLEPGGHSATGGTNGDAPHDLLQVDS